jgi:mannose/fructose/sorbose-specific phosphotransferase system IIA component
LVGIVIVAHGQMADGLLDAARMIAGQQEHLMGLGLQETENVDSLVERVEQAVEQVDSGDGTLVLVDLFGASPFNASARLAMTRENVEVLSGVSLPMVLESAMQREGRNLEELVAIAKEAGTSGIKTLSETLRKKSS